MAPLKTMYSYICTRAYAHVHVYAYVYDWPPQVTMLDAAGEDYPCEASDGPDAQTACQIACASQATCMEPYRLCLAHGECSAIALNDDLSFATLKRSGLGLG